MDKLITMSGITEEIAHIKGHPEKLIVFLHGYIDNSETLNRTITPFVDAMDNCAIHLPQAPIPCEIHERKRQWYSMHEFDPNDERKTVPTMRECAAIYNKMTRGFVSADGYLAPYIDSLLSEYGLDESKLYLCGFSQGAMLAIFSALMREENIGGCVSFSGIIAPHSYLSRHASSHPDMLLIHGDADNLVRFKAQDYTRKKLETLGCKVENYIISGGQHRITADGLSAAACFISTR